MIGKDITGPNLWYLFYLWKRGGASQKQISIFNLRGKYTLFTLNR